MKLDPRVLRLSEILEGALDVLIANARKLIGVQLAAGLVLTMVTWTGLHLAAALLQRFLGEDRSSGALIGAALLAVATYVVAPCVVSSAALALFARAVTAFGVDKAERPGARVLAASGAGALYGVILAGFVLTLSAAGALLAREIVSMGRTSGLGAEIAAFGLFAVTLLAAAVHLIVKLTLASVVVAFEGTPIRVAFSRSAELVRGRYLDALALLLVLWAIAAIGTSVSAVFVTLPYFEELPPGELSAKLPAIVSSEIERFVIGQALALFTHTYVAIAWILFYRHARAL